MDHKTIAKNTAIAFIAQGTSLMLSIIQSLLVPRLLGVEQYGYWQLFIFYASYVGFFHLGLNDGVYLIHGGEDRGVIDKESIKSQFVILVVFQIMFAVLLLVVATHGTVKGERLFVLCCTAVYLVIQNAAWFLMYLLQAMNETRISSYSTIVNRLSFLIPLFALLFVKSSSFKPFAISYIISALLQLLYCAWHCRDILCSRLLSLRYDLTLALESIRVGSKLMLANIASTLSIGVLRMAIDITWGITTFGKLSFSLSLVNFFLAFVSQAAMVLFPALRQCEDNEIRSFYIDASNLLGLLFPAIYLFYFPMVFLLSMWLPAYVDSLRYFAWLIPICVFDSKMNITCTTLFKVKRKETVLLVVNVATTLCCAVMVFASVFLARSFEMAIASTTFCIIARSLVSERIVSNDLEVAVSDISLWELSLSCVFVTLTMMLPSAVAITVYAALYFIFLLTHKRQIISYIDKL